MTSSGLRASLPPHLDGRSAQGGALDAPVAQFEIGGMRNFVYLALDWPSRRAAIVDPQKDLSAPLAFLKAHGFALERVLLTHTHHDHVAGVPELARTHASAPITVHEADTHRIRPMLQAAPAARIELVRDGQVIELGSSTRIRVLHTPGHSAGECTYLLETARHAPHLFTGDTLFIRDCGRTDFEDGSDPQMFASLQRIGALDPRTIILPGHHYAPECASTLEAELETSPPLRCRSVEELASLP